MSKKVRVSNHVQMDKNTEFDRLLKKIASNIKTYRERSGLTQMDMIDHGFNYRHYQRLESGTTGYNLQTLFRLSKVFKIDISDFFKN